MHDGNQAVRLALTLREQFDTPAEMLAALHANMELSDDVGDVIGTLALDHDATGIAWLASVFYAAGRIDRSDATSRARMFESYSRGARRRSAT